MGEHARQVVETLRTPDVGHAACARFVARFIRPQGIEVESTPLLVAALERLASSRRVKRTDAGVPVSRAVAALADWISSPSITNPARIAGTVDEQRRIFRKRHRNARKTRRTASARRMQP